jgi:hypothetical protein
VGGASSSRRHLSFFKYIFFIYISKEKKDVCVERSNLPFFMKKDSFFFFFRGKKKKFFKISQSSVLSKVSLLLFFSSTIKFSTIKFSTVF